MRHYSGMEEPEFWKIIDESKQKLDRAARVKSIQNELAQLSPDEIADFHMKMLTIMHLADRLDLIAACSMLIEEGSNDGFASFRAWLISEGHDTFTRTLVDPDSLALIDFDRTLLFPEFLTVAEAPYSASANSSIKEHRSVVECERRIANEVNSRGEEWNPLMDDQIRKLLPKMYRRWTGT